MKALMATRFPDRYEAMLERLRSARTEAGLTQVEVATKLDVMQTYVSKVETGERRLDPFELEELARLYGKPLSFFMTPD